MKNFTLLFLGTLLFSSVVSAQQRFAGTSPKAEKFQKKSLLSRNPEFRISARQFPLTRGEDAILKPQVESVYLNEEGEWLPYMDLHYKYDLRGNITESFFEGDGSQNKTVYTYDENDKVLTKNTLVSEDGGKTWVNTERNEYEYDEVVQDFVIKKTFYTWNNGEWLIGYSNIFDITRNEKGYVTRMAIKTYYQGDYEEIEAIEVEYDNGDLPAKTWKHFMLNDDLELVEVTRFENIKWENSDGQILSNDEEAYWVGNNRMKEAKIYDEGVLTAKLKVTYSNKRDFESIVSSVSGPDEFRHIFTDTDEYGSYKEQIMESLDTDGDGVMEDYATYSEATCDSHGNIVLFNIFEVIDGETDQVDGTETKYTYGDNDRILETINSMWNYDEQKYEPMEKIVANDFIDVTQQTGIVKQAGQALKYSVENGRLFFSMDGAAHYAIYNVNGMQVLGKGMTDGSESLSLSDFQSGLYLLIIEGSEGTVKVKFMKN